MKRTHNEITKTNDINNEPKIPMEIIKIIACLMPSFTFKFPIVTRDEYIFSYYTYTLKSFIFLLNSMAQVNKEMFQCLRKDISFYKNHIKNLMRRCNIGIKQITYYYLFESKKSFDGEVNLRSEFIESDIHKYEQNSLKLFIKLTYMDIFEEYKKFGPINWRYIKETEINFQN